MYNVIDEEEPSIPSKSWEDLESEFLLPSGAGQLGVLRPYAGPGRQCRVVWT